MDLKQVALGYYRHSFGMAQRFYEEAIKRRNEIDITSCKPYIQNVLQRIDSLQQKSPDVAAEDALFMSTLFQNYPQTF